MKLGVLYGIFLVFAVGAVSCIDQASSTTTSVAETEPESPSFYSTGVHTPALLASRFRSMDDFKKKVNVRYFKTLNGDSVGQSKVILTYSDNGQEVVSTLSSGISQDDIVTAKDADVFGKAEFVLKSPFAIRNRVELEQIFHLARRKYDVYGEGDVAFYDLAASAAQRIASLSAFHSYRDSSEKGYINTFNHITAQALITTLYSVELADFIADVHELHNMPELTTGVFTPQQLVDTLNYPEDNYIDMVNNEIGQRLGEELRIRYRITNSTVWTPLLLANYLNDIQSYYAWSFQCTTQPFTEDDDLIVRFATKINRVRQEV